MNLSDIGSRVSTLLRAQPGSLGLYTSAELSAAINDAQMLFCLDAFGLKATGSVETVPNVYRYALSASYMAPYFISEYGVSWNGNQLSPSPKEDMLWNYSNKVNGAIGTPSRYRINGDYLEIDPTPSESKTLRLYHTYYPQIMVNANAVPEIPYAFHIALVYLAAAILSYKDEKEMRKSSFYKTYQMIQSRFESADFGFNSDNTVPMNQFVLASRRHGGGIII